MKKILTAILAVAGFALALGSAQAQTEPPKVFEVVGKEIPVTEVPALKGRWYNPRNNASQALRFEGGNVYVWGTTRACGEDQLTVVKAYQDSDVLTIETGPSKDQIRCNTEYGRIYSINTKTKQGTYNSKRSFNPVLPLKP
ncbi:hypothetical protein LP417_35360 (plasmid) [Polaromonas sp. P1-6]|nr:hypothetical protein LP417_35360 [Polaromonas sp. P1-6]